MAQAQKKTDETDRIKDRFEYLVIHRYRDKEKIRKAIDAQDSIRSKTSGKFSGADEIRKWREAR